MAKTKVVTVHHGATPQNPTGKTDPLAAQAKAATDLRYAPELSALNLLLAQAGQTYQQGKGQAQSAANSIVAATNQAAPGLADFLQRAGQRQSSVLGQVGAGSQPRLASEAAIAAQNHGLDVQSAAAQLAREKVRAAEAGAYQAKRLYGDYTQQVGQIQQRGTDLSKEAGMYASQLYQGSVADAAKAQAQAEKDARNRLTQRLIAGVDLQGQTIPGSPKAQSLATAKTAADAAAAKARKAAAPKPNAADTNGNTPKQRAAAQDAYTAASVAADTYKIGFPKDWQGLYRFLVTQKNLNPMQARAAAQRAVLGRIDSATAKALAKRGVKIPTRHTQPNPIVGITGSGRVGSGASG